MRYVWHSTDGTRETYHRTLGRLVDGAVAEGPEEVVRPLVDAGLLRAIEAPTFSTGSDRRETAEEVSDA
jgi:hypothetical protein